MPEGDEESIAEHALAGGREHPEFKSGMRSILFTLELENILTPSSHGYCSKIVLGFRFCNIIWL